MWQCKYCNEEFDFVRTTDKANHSRHCIKNPNKYKSYKKLGESVRKKIDNDLGKIKDFNVICYNCGKDFFVEERESKFPSKEKYYCSRSCSNSAGGNMKSKKYGYKKYKTIASKYYKQQCAVCGITDILEVHHIDENRHNFHPSNLIFLCPNDHYRLHRNKDENVKKVIAGHGTAWGGHFSCTEDISGVQIPDAPPNYFLGE